MKALLKLIPLLALTGLVACSANGVKNGDLSGATRPVGNGDVGDIIEFGDERISFSRSDVAVYQVDLINRDDENVRVQYKAQWYDADGIEVDSVARSWSTVYVYAGSHKAVKSVAPNMEAVRCEMEVSLYDPMTR